MHIESQVKNSTVAAVTGEEIKLPLGDHPVSLCCHSDSPGCLEIVKTARTIVEKFNATHFASL